MSVYLNRAPHGEGADGVDGTGAQAGPLFFPGFCRFGYSSRFMTSFSPYLSISDQEAGIS